MRRILSILFLALATFTTSADVLIYRASERVKFTGLEHEAVVPYRSYWIIDLNTTNVASVHWFSNKGDKRYHTNLLARPWLSKVEGKNRSFSFLTESISGAVEPWSVFTFAKGRNQNITIGTGRTAYYPRTFTGTGGQVGPGPQGGPISFEATYSFVYAQSMTVTNNDAGNDAQTILNGIAQQLESDGYYSSAP